MSVDGSPPAFARPLRFASLCSGIESASVAWEPLGWQAAYFSEIDPFACAVLRHHYPTVPNRGDMRDFQEWPNAPIDLAIAGTPCQSFSVAGRREGFSDPRGDLTRVFGDYIARRRPRWVVWENVPGILSLDRGRAFGSFLENLGQCGYGWAYRILDAQYFGVPQRRRRVFVVAHSGGAWQRAAAVLFERHSLSGHPPPRRSATEEAARAIARCSFSGGAGGRPEGAAAGHFVADTLCAKGKRGGVTQQDAHGGLLIETYGGNNTAGPINVATACRAHAGSHVDFESETFITCTLTASHDASSDGVIGGTPLVPVAFNLRGREGGAQPEVTDVASLCAASGGSSRSYDAFQARGSNGGGHQAALTSTGVRRLMPAECERLQGFPDNYTLVPYRGKPACDGPRYKAIGNSKAVPVVRWIGERIAMVDAIAVAQGLVLA